MWGFEALYGDLYSQICTRRVDCVIGWFSLMCDDLVLDWEVEVVFGYVVRMYDDLFSGGDK